MQSIISVDFAGKSSKLYFQIEFNFASFFETALVKYDQGIRILQVKISHDFFLIFIFSCIFHVFL